MLQNIHIVRSARSDARVVKSEVRSLCPDKKIDFDGPFKRKTTFADFFPDFHLQNSSPAIIRQSSLARQPPLQQFLICRIFPPIFHQSFLGQSLKTAITSAVFDHSLSRQPSLQQSFLESLKTAITSAVFDHCFLSAVFSAVFVDSHYFGSL